MPSPLSTPSPLSVSRHVIDLPFSKDALDPYITAKTLEIHYNKHHHGYGANLEDLTVKTPSNGHYADMSLEETIKVSCRDKNLPIYNNAAQVWNHNFYWQSICPPKESQRPTEGAFFQAICSYGGFESIVSQLIQMGISQFASGWAWLVRTETGSLDIRKTSNADPVWLNGSDYPLLIVDVWEHAYYLDYQNRRAEHLKQICDNILNWSFAQSRFLHAVSEIPEPKLI